MEKKDLDELKKVLGRAVNSGKFLITVSYIDKSDKDRLCHYHLMVDYPIGDIVVALSHHSARLKEENSKFAEIGGDDIGKEWE